MKLTVERPSTTVKRINPIPAPSARLTGRSPATGPAFAIHPHNPAVRIADLSLGRQPLRRLPRQVQKVNAARISHVSGELLAERILLHLHLQAGQAQEQRSEERR